VRAGLQRRHRLRGPDTLRRRREGVQGLPDRRQLRARYGVRGRQLRGGLQRHAAVPGRPGLLRRAMLRRRHRPAALRRLHGVPAAGQRGGELQRRRVRPRRVHGRLQQLRQGPGQRLRDRRDLRVRAGREGRLLHRPRGHAEHRRVQGRPADLQRAGHRLRVVHRRGPARRDRPVCQQPRRQLQRLGRRGPGRGRRRLDGVRRRLLRRDRAQLPQSGAGQPGRLRAGRQHGRRRLRRHQGQRGPRMRRRPGERLQRGDGTTPRRSTCASSRPRTRRRT
jgi:hypothetical protein